MGAFFSTCSNPVDCAEVDDTKCISKLDICQQDIFNIDHSPNILSSFEHAMTSRTGQLCLLRHCRVTLLALSTRIFLRKNSMLLNSLLCVLFSTFTNFPFTDEAWAKLIPQTHRVSLNRREDFLFLKRFLRLNA
jgi:hypothetical protein